MTCFDIDKIREHLECQIEIEEYDDGHLTVECITCGKILLSLYPLILPEKFKRKPYGQKNYHIRGH